MSRQDTSPGPGGGLDHALMMTRYGTLRSAAGATLFSWINLTLLLTFGWPALVVFFDAPSVAIENTPLDWFVLRLGFVVTGALLTVVLWMLSPAPVAVATLRSVAGIARRGMIWTQAVLILTGISVLLSVLLLLADPDPALKVISFGLLEAIAVQTLLSGYMKSAFDVLVPGRQSFLSVLGLFAAFFALRSFALAVVATGGGENEVLALLAGGVLGAVYGAVSLLLRDRSGSLLPGILLHWAALYLIAPYLD